jgi:hypothetical protein
MIQTLEKYAIDPVTHFSYFIVKAPFSKKSILFKEYRYTAKNMNKFFDVLDKLKDTSRISISFERYLTGWQDKGRDIELALSLSMFIGGVNYISIEFDYSKYSHLNWSILVQGALDFLLSNQCKITYGLVISSESFKMPGVFTLGIGTRHLSDREEDTVKILSEIWSGCPVKITRLYWGNLIYSEEGLLKETIDSITWIVGHENVIMFSPYHLWLNLPILLNDYSLNEILDAELKLVEILGDRVIINK